MVGGQLRRGTLGGSLQGVQIPLGVQGVVADPVSLHHPADVPGPLEVGLVQLQLIQVAFQSLGQGMVPVVDGLDLLQGHVEGAQEFYPLEDGEVLLGIVPIAIGSALRADESLGFVKANVGPGQAGACFHLLDCHTYRSPSQWVYARIRYQEALQSRLSMMIVPCTDGKHHKKEG